MMLLLNDFRLCITYSVGRKMSVFCAWKEKPLLLGSEVCLCVFQACSDEEDAENDDLNDAGESSSNTPLFNGENQDFIPPQRVLGLWKLGLCREQPCNIQQRQHKSEQRG